MSDSDAGPPLPSATRIEKALRSAVISIFKSGNTDALTVKRVRTVAEKELDLPADFLKNETWKKKSHDIIHTQVNQCEADNAASSPTPEPSPPKKKAAAAKRAPKSKDPKAAAALKKSKLAADAAPRGAKRKSPAAKPKPQKRRKVAVSSDEDSDAAESLPSEASPPKPRPRANAKVVQADSDEEMSDATPAVQDNKASGDDESDQEDKISPIKSKAVASKAGDLSESELSDVFDEPPRKPRQKSSTSDKSKKAASAPKPRAPKAKDAKELDPKETEIKQLQTQLVSCGIKKIWSRYLAPYDTPKAKINHLKELLKDAGMDGRYTLEKAQKIKAKRELDAELDAVQEGAKAWGGGSDGGRPRRRAAARAAKPVVPIKFDSDDSEEDSADKDVEDNDSESDAEEDQDDEDQDGESAESAFSSDSD